MRKWLIIEIPRWNGQFWGFVWSIEKHWESVLWRFTQQRKSITVTAGLRQPRAVLQTDQCQITLSTREKSDPANRPFVKIFDHFVNNFLQFCIVARVPLLLTLKRRRKRCGTVDSIVGLRPCDTAVCFFYNSFFVLYCIEIYFDCLLRSGVGFLLTR